MSQFSLTSLTGWDWFIVIVSVASILLGLVRGIVRTVFGLAAWVVALVGTPLLAPAAVEASAMHQQPWVVFVVLFIALFVVVRFAGVLLARVLGKLGLGGADRSLGALLGAARALVLIALAVVLARSFDLHRSPEWRQAVSRPLLDAIVQWAEPYLPPSRASGVRRT